MPTMSFALRDLNKLVGRTLNEAKLKELLSHAKAELESITNDAVFVKFNDTNLPWLWSVEGLAAWFRGVLGAETGIPKLKVEKTNYKVVVDASTRQVRPYIAAFVAKGNKLDDCLLKQLIQLQEKLCENYGRKRQKVAIGIYPAKKITFPLTYKAVRPESVSFVPLEFKKEMTLKQILDEHPTGRAYATLLRDAKMYPLLVDARKEILSFPPIINSETTGRLAPGDDEIFFEATGTDNDSVVLLTNIFAFALSARGFKIFSVNIAYGNKTVATPVLSTRTVKLKKEQIKNRLGIDLKDAEVKKLLERARYGFKNYSVEIPPFRHDIMHPCDVIEDVAIMYGYANITPLPLTSYTKGSTFEIQQFVDKMRDLCVGLGYIEVFSPILSSKEVLSDKMLARQSCIEIENFTTQTYSAVRSWLIPVLVEVLSKNKHAEFPQKIFEQGTAVLKSGERVEDRELLALATSHRTANYTEARQAADFILSSIGVKAKFEEVEHSSFVPGRVAAITLNGEHIGIVGELHPEVLDNFFLEMPVAVLELDLTVLFRLLQV